MHIEVGPARRPGNASAIYDEPLSEADLEMGSDGGIVLTVRASGMNSQKSLYRYKISLSRLDADKIVRAMAKP
jgi:hypothetical protein